MKIIVITVICLGRVQVMSDEKCNVLASLPKEERLAVRKMMIRCVVRIFSLHACRTLPTELFP